MARTQTTRKNDFPDYATKDILAALPIAHLLACGFFLYGYSRTFGFHTIALASFQDIFPISVREMGIVYFGLLVPLALRAGALPDRAAAAATSDAGAAAPSPRRRVVQTKWNLVWFCLCAITVCLLNLLLIDNIVALTSERIGMTISGGLLILLWLAEVAVIWRTRRLRFSSFEVAAIGTTLLVCGCLLFGVHKGMLDANRDFERSVGRYLSCQPRGLLVRRLGGSDIVLVADKTYWVGAGLCSRASTHADLLPPQPTP